MCSQMTEGGNNLLSMTSLALGNRRVLFGGHLSPDKVPVQATAYRGIIRQPGGSVVEITAQIVGIVPRQRLARH